VRPLQGWGHVVSSFFFLQQAARRPRQQRNKRAIFARIPAPYNSLLAESRWSDSLFSVFASVGRNPNKSPLASSLKFNADIAGSFLAPLGLVLNPRIYNPWPGPLFPLGTRRRSPAMAGSLRVPWWTSAPPRISGRPKTLRHRLIGPPEPPWGSTAEGVRLLS
jgi:hypothetical protein